MKTIKFLSAISLALLAFTSCSNDDSQPVNEEEVITTVTITLTPVGGGNSVVLTSRDLDGGGPNAPVITSTGSVTALTAYNGTVLLQNELVNPAKNITDEVLEEGTEHQFFYSKGGGLTGTFAYADQDDNGNPIGIEFHFNASATAQSGNINVVLRHNPNKTALNVAGGDITHAGGVTDVMVSFPVTVE